MSAEPPRAPGATPPACPTCGRPAERAEFCSSSFHLPALRASASRGETPPRDAPSEAACPACQSGRTVVRVTLDRKCVECGRHVSDEPTPSAPSRVGVMVCGVDCHTGDANCNNYCRDPKVKMPPRALVAAPLNSDEVETVARLMDKYLDEAKQRKTGVTLSWEDAYGFALTLHAASAALSASQRAREESREATATAFGVDQEVAPLRSANQQQEPEPTPSESVAHEQSCPAHPEFPHKCLCFYIRDHSTVIRTDAAR